eukprot:gene14305-32_t
MRASANCVFGLALVLCLSTAIATTDVAFKIKVVDCNGKGVKNVTIKTMDCGYQWEKTTDKKGYVHVNYDNSGKLYDYCSQNTDNKPATNSYFMSIEPK